VLPCMLERLAETWLNCLPGFERRQWLSGSGLRVGCGQSGNWLKRLEILGEAIWAVGRAVGRGTGLKLFVQINLGVLQGGLLGVYELVTLGLGDDLAVHVGVAELLDADASTPVPSCRWVYQLGARSAITSCSRE